MRKTTDLDGAKPPSLRDHRLDLQQRIFPWTRAFARSKKRQPAEGLQREVGYITDDIGITIFTVIGLCAGFILGWSQANAPAEWPENAPIYTFLIVFVLGGYRLMKLGQKYARFHKGARAERKVGDNLDLLLHRGARVVHDIQCRGTKSKFNIDHCVIHPSGIWAIETKFISPGINGILDVSDAGLRTGARKLGDRALRQARGNAATISDILFKATGERRWIHAAVLVEGFTIRGQSKLGMVGSTQSFRDHVQSLPAQLTPQDVKTFAEIILEHSFSNEA